jgi:hypothetical protein
MSMLPPSQKGNSGGTAASPSAGFRELCRQVVSRKVHARFQERHQMFPVDEHAGVDGATVDESLIAFGPFGWLMIAGRPP